MFNYSLTDPQISYHLEGFDKEAVTRSRSELGPVSYTNLPGGSYTFVMELKDAMGRGSKVLSVSIVKEKALYEHGWFYLVIGLLAVLAAALLIRAYIRRKMRLLEEKHREQAKRERLENELQTAAQIQTSMLPRTIPAFPERKEFDLFASMGPAKEVGGDFYDFFLIDDDHLCLVIADVSDKGIPAAMFMMRSKTAIKNYARNGLGPAEILENVNSTLCEGNDAHMFVTVWLGMLDLKTGLMRCANAGHEYPALMRAGGDYALLEDPHGFVLGGFENVPMTEYEIQLTPGDRLFVYTDGIPEAMNTEGKQYGGERLTACLNQLKNGTQEQILDGMLRSIRSFAGETEQFDDITMLGITYLDSISDA